MPLISIVTPSYNQAAYLEHTIRSVLSQRGIDLEYMIVDGGSTDGSQAIIQRYADRLAWWVSEPDAGQAEAINKGLRRAQGEYVAWLNSDDLYLPGALSQAVASLEANPEAGLVFGNALTIDGEGKPLNQLVFPDWELRDLLAFRIICQPAVFMRRSVLTEAGFLEPSFHFMLDHHLWLRMAQVAPILHIASTWAAARHHLQAKNVAQAADFSRETRMLLDWAAAQPAFDAQFASEHKRIEAGALRLQGRYLLDGGLYRQSLGAYGRALARDPRYTLQHSHRILYALLSLIGGRGMAGWYYRLQRRKLPPELAHSVHPE